MSIIVAVRKGAETVIAADTAQSDGAFLVTARYLKNHSKILRHDESFIGMAGWSASQDIFENVLRRHQDKLSFGSRQEIFESALMLHKILKKKYYIDPQEDKEQPVESSQLAALIVNRHGIFDLESYRSVGEYERFWALGSGKPLAMGAMHALYDSDASALTIARAGVAAACEFDEACAMPMTEFSIAIPEPERGPG